MRHEIRIQGSGYRRRPLFGFLFSALFLLSGCGNRPHTNITVSVAEQYGLAYAPVQVMREMGFLESALR